MWPTLFGAHQWEPTQVSRGTMGNGVAASKHGGVKLYAQIVKMDHGMYVCDVNVCYVQCIR